MDESAKPLREAVETLHGCRAVFRQAVQVKEVFEGSTVWEGAVHLFDIDDHPMAKVAYAWSSPVDGSDRRKVYAVLHIPPVDSPAAAVRAAIVSDHRNSEG